MTELQKKRGSWWLVLGVLLLNYFGLGAGYLLLGRWKRAVLLAVVTVVIILFVVLKSGLPYWGVLISLILTVIYIIGLLWDGVVTGRRGKSLTGQFFQNPLVYILCVILNLGLSFLGVDSEPRQGSGITYSIPAGSMQPTLEIGDYILTSGSFRKDWVRRGDVVIFQTKWGQPYVKRVIGLPNETFQMKAGVPHINGTPFIQTPHGELLTKIGGTPTKAQLFEETTPEGRRYEIVMGGPSGALDETPLVTIPEGHVCVLGDNRQNSADSRVADIGAVALTAVFRKADLIYWSADRSRIGKWVQ